MTAHIENDPHRAGTIWTLSQDDPTPEIRPQVEAVFSRLELEDLPSLEEAMGGVDPTEIRQRLDSGRRCYVARVGGRIAAYGWVSLLEEYVGELRLLIRLQPCEANIWDCATPPEFRKNHLYSALLVYIARQLQAESVCRIWIGADLENAASQRGIDRAGFQRVADLAIAKANGMRRITTLGYPGVPENLVSEARRVYMNNRDQVWIDMLQAATKSD